MKYKYLRGSEKDFEGAPEWARQVIKSATDNVGFVVELDYMCKYQGVSGYAFNVSNPGLWKILAERQPVTEPSWDGAGMPPVGCECEFSWAGNEFKRGVLLFASKQTVVIDAMFEGSAGYTEQCYYLDDMKFRPLRSESDKKRDSITSAILSALLDMPWNNEEMAKQIYDAIAAGKIPGVKLED